MATKRNATKTEKTDVIRMPVRPTERTAAQAYAEHAVTIKDLATRLTVALQGHVGATETLNWAHVGDLTEVERLLNEAVCFLTGEDY